MLTKAHLNYRVKAGRVVPAFVKPDDAAALAVATDLIALFDAAAGMTVGELEDQAADAAEGPFAAALTKLLLDGMSEEDDDEAVADSRWATLLRAEAMRREGADKAQFDAAFGASREQLYADLPAARRVAETRTTTPVDLINRYNVAQVQGLLLTGKTLQVRVAGLGLGERRALLRQIKFHRLIAEVTAAADGFALVLSGPLSLFDQARAGYGLRLALFFPHLLHAPTWSLEADVEVKKRTLPLKVDQKAGLVSHYKRSTPHVPAELDQFIRVFNERKGGWSAGFGEEFVHIGRESYCFPDLTFANKRGKRVHVELFHKWHAGQLEGRIQALEKNPVSTLFLGVGKSLAKDAKLMARLEAAPWFRKNGFVFSEFPTPRAVQALLDDV